MVGILNGGGLDCTKLGEEKYQPTSNGRWMRVSKFANWIHEKIFNELLPGRKIVFKKKLSIIHVDLIDIILIKTFQWTETGVDGNAGEDVLHPACRQDTGLVMIQSLREASNEGILLLMV